MGLRLIARVSGFQPDLPDRQFRGLPPQLTGGIDHRAPLPRAHVLIIEEESEGFLLLRYSERGQYAGDTWHDELEAAKAQAEFEYPNSIGEWLTVPAEITDCVAFALQSL
jgi:hypothetical protein